MKHIKTFENMTGAKSSVIKQLASGKLFTTSDPYDLAPLYLAVQRDIKGNLTAVPTQKSPRELSGMVFSRSSEVDSTGLSVIYKLQRI
jgi:hypothetical protein